jgi:AcrR family transcriptional regulator
MNAALSDGTPRDGPREEMSVETTYAQSLQARYGDLVPDARRAKMLKATMLLVAHDDVATVTMNKVAEAAGISRITLYREFGNRGALFEAVIAYRLMKFDHRFFQRRAPTDPFAELVRDYLLASVQIARRNPVTHRWTQGGMTALRMGSLIQQVAATTWRPALLLYNGNFGSRRGITAEAFAQWINGLQYSLSRLSIEAEVQKDDLATMIETFVLPAFR